MSGDPQHMPGRAGARVVVLDPSRRALARRDRAFVGHPPVDRAHPDHALERRLAGIGEAVRVLARMGLGRHVAERVRQAIAVGERQGLVDQGDGA